MEPFQFVLHVGCPQTEVAAALANIGDINEALRVVEQIEKNKTKATALREIALSPVGCCSTQQRQDLLERSVTCLCNLEWHWLWSLKILDAMADVGDPTRTVKLFRSIEHPVLLQEPLQKLVNRLLADPDAPSQVSLLRQILPMYADYGYFLIQLLQQIVKTMPVLVDTPEFQSLTENIAQCENPNLFPEIAKMYFTLGKPEQAHEFGARALQLTESMADESKRQLALITISQTLVEIGDLKLALHAAELMRDATWRDEALAKIAQTLAEAGDLKRALEIADKIDDEERKAGAMGITASVLAGAKKLIGAELVADLIPFGHALTGYLCCIAEAMAEAGDDARARRFFDRAITEALEKDYDSMKVYGAVEVVSLQEHESFRQRLIPSNLWQIADAMNRCGFNKEADNVRRQALRIVAKVKLDWGWDTMELDGLSPEILLLIDEWFNKSKPWSPKFLTAAAIKLAEGDNVGAALNLVERIHFECEKNERSGFDGGCPALATVAKIAGPIVRQGYIEKALEWVDRSDDVLDADTQDWHDRMKIRILRNIAAELAMPKGADGKSRMKASFTDGEQVWAEHILKML